MPAPIRIASATAQKKTTAKMFWRFRPCLSTKAFCAPMAIINAKPLAKPVVIASTRP
jgi:hypothetical protein